MIRFELGSQICVCLSEEELSIEIGQQRHASLAITDNEYLILSTISAYGTLNSPISQRAIENKLAQNHQVTLPENGFKNVIASLRKKFKKLIKPHLETRKNIIENIHRIGYFVPFESQDSQKNGAEQQKRVNRVAKNAVVTALKYCLTSRKLYFDLGLVLMLSSIGFIFVCYITINALITQSYFSDVNDFTDALAEQSCFAEQTTLSSMFAQVELVESSMMIDRYNTRCLVTPEHVMPVSKLQYDKWLENSNYIMHEFDKKGTTMVVRVKNINLARSIEGHLSSFFLKGMKICTNTGTSLHVGKTDGRPSISKETNAGYTEFFYISNPIRNILLITMLMVVMLRYRNLIAISRYFLGIRRFGMKLEPIYDTEGHVNLHYEALSRFTTSNTQKFIETLIARDLLLTHTLLVIKTLYAEETNLLAPVSVNVCPSLLKGDNFRALYQCLTQYDCHYLTIEVTENASMYYTEEIYRNIRLIKSLGCKISIDDFGTGNNNVELIGKIKPDYLKIDRDFVIGMRQDEKKIETVRQLIAMGKAYQCRIIVEGVETAECAHLLTKLGAKIHQGFYYSLT
ncbi:EAL domain-containing protein [Vibrio brasiliensis]|uniref:cyclic di-GMP phosphodiesterase TpdA n=1 Tax=Vibrio brasiliensis TaxID=170652 RepID=UPI001EFD6686|nr:EAL domain-containing protein [Vibrio brasiliensis]MCG9725560.1 EAL domain-containing protein [Vibrio brasiliensis]